MASPPDATPPAGIRLSFYYDDDIAAGVETLLAVLLPPRRPGEPVTAPPGITPAPTVAPVVVEVATATPAAPTESVAATVAAD